MPDYGLRCKDSEGIITLEITDHITRFIGSYNYIAFDESGTLTSSNFSALSNWDRTKGIFLLIPTRLQDGSVPSPSGVVLSTHKVTASGTFPNCQLAYEPCENTRTYMTSNSYSPYTYDVRTDSIVQLYMYQ
tara:strand:- start:4468 stop:4863 length:396 start_codon:yes stop_codon:yes gene_type:complete